MPIRPTIRILAVTTVAAIASVACTGASWPTDEAQAPVAARKDVGVPTGTFVDGVEVHRLPSITVTARRGDAR
jgi:hypothetical protein